MESVTHLHASGNFTDTKTTITVHGSYVDVKVDMLPGLTYWKAPSAVTIRKWVDDALKFTGKYRDGARQDVNAFFSGWRYHYPIKNV